MGLFDGLLGHGSSVDPADLAKRLDGVLIDGERAELAYKVIRDFFVFTQWRLILVDIQGMTGSKVDYLSIPYRAVTRFSVETAGTFDLDSELKVWVSGSNEPIQRTLKKGTDVRGIQRALATGVLAPR
ncbi:PH domain-containing protein [Ciceribacter sp. L1K23]|uniref:PH domain-containing protein n=1 Tax=Ciceribacter sp. L1K23 TaxID=2820276 RepID=UPI001B81C966|nr:PH domain-containing protein [Ciceribacter sp. L1K23]MBR0554843.1 PH domain-containing protein [Ciceribacter sp. L1K23]